MRLSKSLGRKSRQIDNTDCENFKEKLYFLPVTVSNSMLLLDCSSCSPLQASPLHLLFCPRSISSHLSLPARSSSMSSSFKARNVSVRNTNSRVEILLRVIGLVTPAGFFGTCCSPEFYLGRSTCSGSRSAMRLNFRSKLTPTRTSHYVSCLSLSGFVCVAKSIYILFTLSMPFSLAKFIVHPC